MNPADPNGVIAALARDHSSNQVSGHPKSTISMARHHSTTGTCSQMVLGHRKARNPPITAYPTNTKCAAAVATTTILKKSLMYTPATRAQPAQARYLLEPVRSRRLNPVEWGTGTNAT